MLINLHVKNFALIDEADVDFGDGLNILTGETGAGKSLLIDAVNAALGGRLRGNVIRSGADSAYTELVFSVPEQEKKEQLAALDVSTEYDCIVVSRKILQGRSVHKINDETVTSAKVRQVTGMLLDIHGQHEHQSLFHRDMHLAILDEFGGRAVEEVKAHTADAYRACQEARRWLKDLDVNPEERIRQLDFLDYEISEIEETGIRPGETEELEASYRRMANAQKIGASLAEVYSLISSGSASVSEQVGRASREMSEVLRLDPSLNSLAEELSEIEDLTAGLGRELSDYMDQMCFEPEEFRRIEDRLDQLHRLENKYGGSYDTIMAALSERKVKREKLEELDVLRQEAEKIVKVKEAELAEYADELTRLRKEAAIPLEEKLTSGIRELNFNHVNFHIAITPLAAPGRNGQEEAEFMISLNPGQMAGPLAKVASGGELSRIMLAIKAVLADKDEIPTLIFDEIDTGISGRTAQKVSEKLDLIARHRQVICITHLPQIASMADHHFGIRKSSDDDTTITHIEPLDQEASIDELARLLGGAELTKTVYQNALEMKSLATKRKAAVRA